MSGVGEPKLRDGKEDVLNPLGFDRSGENRYSSPETPHHCSNSDTSATRINTHLLRAYLPYGVCPLPNTSDHMWTRKGSRLKTVPHHRSSLSHGRAVVLIHCVSKVPRSHPREECLHMLRGMSPTASCERGKPCPTRRSGCSKNIRIWPSRTRASVVGSFKAPLGPEPPVDNVMAHVCQGASRKSAAVRSDKRKRDKCASAGAVTSCAC